MLWCVMLAFVASVWAVIYWGTIKIVDRSNVKNTLGTALLIGVVYALSFLFPLPGYLMVVAWLLLLMRLSIWHYELNLVGAAIATASTVLVPYLLMPHVVKFVGDSELRAGLLLFGVPAATIGTAIVMRIRNRETGDRPKWKPTHDQPALPEARVVEMAKPVAPPVAVAPPKYTPAPVGDKPSLLS